jgi:hypothetical protein
MSLLYAALTGLPTVEAEAAHAAGLARLPRLERLLSRADARAAPADWRRWQLAAVGLAAPPGDLPAGWWLVGEPGAAAAGSVLVATPVVLRAGMSDVRLERLAAADAAALGALARQFNADWQGEPVTLEARGGGLVLRHRASLAVETVDPATLVGAEIGVSLPRGADGGVLRRLMTELQMWLHACPAAAGINGLWLWGAGRTPLAGRARWPAVAPADALLAAARALHPGDADAALTLQSVDVGTWLAAGRTLPALDAALGALLEARRAGGARLHVGGREFVLAGRQRLRLWRRVRPWWELLA